MGLIKGIEMRQIFANPNNKRRMSEEEIEDLKDSIKEVGLIHPLTVYEDGINRYVLISGHKRLRALRESGRPETQIIPCNVVSKPENLEKEEELMCYANISRKAPEDVWNEIKIANDIWDSMSETRRAELTEQGKNEFIEKYKDNPKYLNDPDKFIGANFRARIWYIQKRTGFSTSDKTILRRLKALKDCGGDTEVAAAKKEPKVKVITLDTINKAVDSLYGQMQAYMKTEDGSFTTGDFDTLYAAVETYYNAKEGEA